MIEVKALHANLAPAKDKGFAYCWKNKVPFFVVTDGERWEVYNMEKMGGEEIAVANICENLGHAARQLLALWRPAMPEVTPPPPSICLPSPPKKVAESGVKVGELPIDELFAKLKTGEIPRGSKPPAKICFPDGQSRVVKYWRDLLTAVVEWAAERARLLVPIRLPTGTLIVANTPLGMRNPKKVVDYYVETHASSLYIVRFLQIVLAEIGLNAKDFRVTF